ncbi:MAG: hypothetical protein EPN79_16040 [Burkholderiaceae bacterium]|nr:MAG: hypothetical protein EPN79_16040 [Burkholderiaceae bacterium]
MAMNLLVDDLKRVAEGPNGLDREVLLQIQRSLMSQVMTLYRDDYLAFDQQLQARNLSPEQCREERAGLLAQLLRDEYRHRASNGQGFSLPMYVEAATNHYRMEIQRLGQSISDYVMVSRQAAELHYTESRREIRTSGPEMRQLSERVAEQLDKLETAIASLGRVSRNDAPKKELETLLTRIFADAKKDQFAGPMVEEARTLAAARQYERRHGLEGDIAAPCLR